MGEFSSIDVESNDETTKMLFGRRRCCFCMPCFGSANRSSSAVGFNWWHKIRTKEREDEGLWARGVNSLKKLREWSEIAAGPRWKTFIRRFNRNKSGGRNGKFQYDPLSYALNFDEGPGQNGNSDEDDDRRFRNFSARYATVPASANSLVDLGSKDGSAFL